MFKDIGEFIIMCLFIGFLFYLIVYIVMGFPHPQWLIEGTGQLQQQISSPN